MQNNLLYAGIDLGGTNIKLGLVDKKGTMIERLQTPTHIEGGVNGVLAQCHRLLLQAMQRRDVEFSQIAGVGFGVPAFVDHSSGHVKEAINLGWREIPLRDTFQSLTGFTTYVDNDANLAALGELCFGAGQTAENLVMVTLGTGVGGGVIIDRQIVHGTGGMAGEIGHLTLIPDGGLLCHCGKTGCLETLSSAKAIARKATRTAIEGKSTFLHDKWLSQGMITARDVAAEAERGDQVSREIFNEAGFYLGLGLSHVANMLNPDVIIVGGGLAHAGDILFDPLRQSFAAFALPCVQLGTKVLSAQLGNDAGILGAARAVQERVS